MLDADGASKVDFGQDYERKQWVQLIMEPSIIDQRDLT